MKKTLLTIGIIFIVMISCITSVQADAGEITLVASNATVKPGETFTVTMHATASEGINGIYGKEEFDGIGFNYDNTKLELVSREAKTVTDANSGNDTIILIYLGLETITSEDVYVWTFKVKDNAAEGETQISTTEIIFTDLANDTTEVGAKTATVQIKKENNENTNTNTNTNTSTNTNANTNTNNNTSINTNTSSNTNTNSNTNTYAGTNTNSGNTNTRTNTGSLSYNTSTPGKAIDTTTANTILPKTGFKVITGIGIISLIALAIIMYKKLKQYDDVK